MTAGQGPRRSGWQTKVSIVPALVGRSICFSIITVPPRCRLFPAGHEVRILEARFAIAERRAVECRDAAAGGLQHRLARRRIPFHGAAETGVEVGLAGGDQAELDRTAGDAALGLR